MHARLLTPQTEENEKEKNNAVACSGYILKFSKKRGRLQVPGFGLENGGDGDWMGIDLRERDLYLLFICFRWR